MPIPQYSEQANLDQDGLQLIRQDIGSLCREARGPHNNLLNRDADDTHPIAAITLLTAPITEINTRLVDSYSYTWMLS
jgi:hypothetical protein